MDDYDDTLMAASMIYDIFPDGEWIRIKEKHDDITSWGDGSGSIMTNEISKRNNVKIEGGFTIYNKNDIRSLISSLNDDCTIYASVTPTCEGLMFVRENNIQIGSIFQGYDENISELDCWKDPLIHNEILKLLSDNHFNNSKIALKFINPYLCNKKIEEFIRQNPKYIDFFEITNNDFIEEIVANNLTLIGKIKNPSRELILKAINELSNYELYSINVNHLNIDNEIDFEILCQLIKKNKYLFRSLKRTMNMTDVQIDKFIESIPELKPNSLKTKYYDKNTKQLNSIKKDPLSIKNMKQNEQTLKICLKAIKQKPESIKYIHKIELHMLKRAFFENNELFTDPVINTHKYELFNSIFKNIVELDNFLLWLAERYPSQIIGIPEKYLTQELVNIALNEDFSIYNKIPQIYKNIDFSSDTEENYQYIDSSDCDDIEIEEIIDILSENPSLINNIYKIYPDKINWICIMEPNMIQYLDDSIKYVIDEYYNNLSKECDNLIY